MDHKRSVGGRNTIMTVALLSLSAVSQAAPVDTIFAAENSLYGRGYDIGRADGWMDAVLRRAISRFQSRTRGLSATGNLDPATLKALSVDADGGTISGNALASQQAAIAALDLTTNPAVPKADSPAGITAAAAVQAVAEAEPKPAPTPEPAPAKTGTTTPAPVVVAKTPEPTATPVPTPASTPASAPKPAIDPQPTVTMAPAMAEPDLAVLKEQPEPETARVDATTQTVSKAPAKHVVTPTHTETNVVQASASSDSRGDDQNTTVAREPTAPADAVGNTSSQDQATKPVAEANGTPAKPATETVDTKSEQSGQEATGSRGGFFSWLFDLLFGWIA